MSIFIQKRWDIINMLIKKHDYHSFLEIGTAEGETFNHVIIDKKVSVDPNPNTKATYVMTSDEYFKRYTKHNYDIIFIDGLHEAEQVWRDIQNALKHLTLRGMIVMHDVYPSSKEMQEPFHGQHFWTGDVWKAFIKARRELPYEVYAYDYDFGVGVIDPNWIRNEDVVDLSYLPDDMSKMTYEEWVKHPEWMNLRKIK